jgi:5-methylcytosine-specific restriction endonuclease McrA
MGIAYCVVLRDRRGADPGRRGSTGIPTMWGPENTMTRVIDQSVLVLNRNWQPVAIFSVGVAITTVMREMGWILEPESCRLLEWEAWCATEPQGARPVKTPSGSVPAPEVIVLREYAGQPRRGTGFSRANLFRRDEFTCQFCGFVAKHLGAEALTIDHVLPRSRGGGTTWENCVAACEPCNSRKADRTPQEAGMPLRQRPRKPRWQPTLKVAEQHVRPAWETFVSGSGVRLERR